MNADNARKQVLERIAEAVGEGLETIAKPVQLGLHSQFDDHEITSRILPLRAIQVSFTSGLADCMVVVTTMPEDKAREAVVAAAAHIGTHLEIEVAVAPPLAYEFTEREDALEQLEALWDEPTMHYTTPHGDLLVVFGSGLVQTVQAHLFPWTVEGPPSDQTAAAGIDLSGGAEAPSAPPEAPVQTAAADMGTAIDFPAPTPITAAGTGYGATAMENALAADASGRWTHLLSGVDVELSAELGRTEMQLGDVVSLIEDSVLTLDQLVEDPVTVYVNGALFATARLVVVDDQYGIEIVEVLEPEAAAL